jgi:hypothetical protein
MSGQIVNCQQDTRIFLTVETKGQGGGVTASLCDLDGKPIMDNGIKYAGDHPDHVEAFLDAISGEYFARIPASKANQMMGSGGKVFVGVGGVQGFFVPAPDFTVNGRNGGKAAAPAAPEDKKPFPPAKS